MAAVRGWGGLDLRHLVALRAVAEEGSFNGAAVRLGYTQPAISHQIAALERIVGKRLVNRPRTGSGLSLTEAGSRLVAHVASIEAALTAAHAELAALDGASGAEVVRVGAYQSVSATIVPEVLRTLASTAPSVTVDLTDTPGDFDLVEELASGSLDLAFVELPLPTDVLVAEPVLRDPYVLLVAPDSPLADAEPLTAAELARVPLALFKRSRSTDAVVSRLRADGVALDVIVRTDDNWTINGIVSSGYAAAIVPGLAARDAPGVVRRDLAHLVPPRVIGLARHSAHAVSAAADAFVRATHTAVERLKLTAAA